MQTSCCLETEFLTPPRNLDHLSRAVPQTVSTVVPHSEHEATYSEPSAEHYQVSAPTSLQSASAPAASGSGGQAVSTEQESY